MTSPQEMTALRLRLGPPVWRRMCRHLDGIAIGTTVAALQQAGILDVLARARGPLDIDALARAHHSPRGIFHLAMRLIEEQGWVEREGEADGGRRAVCLTDAGKAWLPHAGSYTVSAPALAAGQELFVALVGGTGFDERRFAAICAAMPSGNETPERVRDHLWGPLAAAATSGLKRSRCHGGEPAVAAAFDVLKRQDWALAGPDAAPSDAGRLALDWAAQYDHSISYFPTFAAVGERLFPSPTRRTQSSSDPDRHLDRRLDIDFSGTVFSRTCRDSFFALALPLFESLPLALQPTAIIDTGAGDGSLLRELHGAIRDQTKRGRALEAYPLAIVGVEPSPVAREVIAASFAKVGVAPIIIDGDIGNPDGIAHRLAPLGIDLTAALHVSKSVVHDRRYEPQQRPDPPVSPLPWPPSDAVFVAADDDLIPHQALQSDLVRHFRKWLPWIGEHGMIVIEAHTVPAKLIAAHEGRNVMTSLDASHGYSHQYLVERSTYLRAAAEAGLVASASRALAAEMLGTPILTIDHWRPASPRHRSA